VLHTHNTHTTMRWRSGPQNEVNADENVPDMPNLDGDDEGVGSHVDDDRSMRPSRGRLGGASALSLPPASGADVDAGDDNEGGGLHTNKADDHDRAAAHHHDDDDPGTDHAVDPQAPAPTWKPQDQQSTCEFTHTITNYSQKRESGCKKAEYSATTVDEFGNRWRLIIYVNGNGRASNHHLSLFLQVADADDLPFGWKKAVSYVLTLEHPTGANLGYAKRNPDKTFKLCPKAIDWGWSQFITSDRIQQEGYVSSDSLTVRASVTVKSSSVNIDAEDAELYLKSAVEDGSAKAVETCLAQGAGVNCQFKDDLYTPLHTACSSSSNSGSLEVLNLLLERGADGNACNKWRETPLLIAANNGHHAAVNALLDHGADPSLCSEAGWSALTFAAHKGYNDIVTLLLKAGAPVNVRVTEDLSTPLHKACAGGKLGHLSAVKQLLENGADVHALNKWRETPLLTAANHGQGDAVEALLKHGADPCKCTDTGWSPLSIAAYKGHDDVVRLLLEEGAPTEEADPTLSALLQAATKGLPDTVELLLRHGADHTVTTKKGDTALSILVEQNLIDAAVEMVTEYKASVPRCSRDRKKVQRARLLINLRVKQQQREGLLTMDDGETDEETDEGHMSLLDSGGPTSKKKKKKKKGSLASAEAQAKAAEEALLMELEQEESQAQKDEAVATSKRAKKKKKKEREREIKMKEEEEVRAQEEVATKKRDSERKVREDKERKEREVRLQEEREEDMRQAEVRDRKAKEAAAKRKDREDKDRQKRDEERKEQDKLDQHRLDTDKKAYEIVNGSPPSVGYDSSSKAGGRKGANSMPTNGQHGFGQSSRSPNSSKPLAGSRGWETKAKNSVTAPPLSAPQTLSQTDREVSSSSIARTSPVEMASTIQPQSAEEDMAASTSVADFLGFNSGQSQTNQSRFLSPQSPAPQRDNLSFGTGGLGNSALNPPKAPNVELPQLVLYRQEKLGQLFQRCAVARSQPQSDPLGSVSEHIIKTVVYRWIIRAAHDTAPFLDCMIPSWTDFDSLCAFLQRQFIAESRKATPGLLNMEVMKEAGTSFARLCHSLAKDLVQFRKQREEQLPSNWTDDSLGVSGNEVTRNGLGTMICIDWANRAQVYFKTATFAKATERHVGTSRRLLTALFAAKKRYEIMGMLISGTAMDQRLTPGTKDALSRKAATNVELWSGPFEVYGNNNFFGCFDDVDAAFGGFMPFGKEDVAVDLSMLKRGGSMAVLPPLDNMVASIYMRRVVNLLERGDNERIPLSFIVFLHTECFRQSSRSPTVNDALELDPRLGERHGVYIRCAELLHAGQHSFQTGEGDGTIQPSRAGSIFLLLQNEAGKNRYPMTEASLVAVIRSMNASYTPPPANVVPQSPVRYTEGYVAPEPVPMPSVGYQDHLMASPSPSLQTPISHPDFGAFGAGPTLHNSGMFSQGSNSNSTIGVRPRRGRLFDLIDDGDEDTNGDVPGMLNNLDASLFKNNPSQEIDIEAISLGLMGISGTSLGDSGVASDNTRTTSRFLG
jgi:ankyrin repeat protein